MVLSELHKVVVNKVTFVGFRGLSPPSGSAHGFEELPRHYCWQNRSLIKKHHIFALSGSQHVLHCQNNTLDSNMSCINYKNTAMKTIKIMVQITRIFIRQSLP